VIPQVPRLRLLVGFCLGVVGCAPSSSQGARHLHRVDGQLVSTPAPNPRAYEAYLRARLALDLAPPDFDRATAAIELALRHDPFDPHLWTTRAEIYAAAGNLDEANRSLDEALELRPGYAPAESLRAQLDTPPTQRGI